MMHLWVLGLSVLAGLLYRAGGSSIFPSWVRDWGVSPVFALVLVILGLIHGILAWVCLAIAIGLMGAALSTYHYFLPKPANYNGFWYALHGLAIGLAAFPIALVTHHWLGYGLRVLVLPIFMGIWYGTMKKNDFWHEFGRGFICVASAPLLLI